MAEIANELSDRHRWSFLNCLTRLLSAMKRKKKDRNRSSEMGSRAHFLGQGSGFEKSLKSDHVRGIFQTTGGRGGGRFTDLREETEGLIYFWRPRTVVPLSLAQM